MTMVRATDGAAKLVETSPVFCRRCGKKFDHLVIEDVKGIMQLRIAGLLVMELHANCLICGWRFHWNIREKDVEKMATMYGEVLAYARSGYMPE